MSGRLTNMQYSTLIVVAVLSLIFSYPATHQQPVAHATEVKHTVSVKQVSSTHPVVPAPAKPVATVAPVVVTPTPAPVQPAPAPIVYAKGSCSSYGSLFAQYGWSVSTAEAICQAESGGDPNAASPTDDYGLMQINHGYEIYGAAIYDPAFNIKIAYTVKYVNSGWYPWTTYTSGKYLNYL